MRINALERIIVEIKEDGSQTSRLPNNQEIMNKINEIVRVVNQLDEFRANELHKKFVKVMTKGW